MSAVEEYRKECASRGLWPVPEDGSLLCIADAAIAALEAENRELQLDLKDVLKKRDLCEARHEQAEAELAALRGRRCENCDSSRKDQVDDPCDRFSEQFLAFMRDHCNNTPVYCSCWAARAEEGGEDE